MSPVDPQRSYPATQRLYAMVRSELVLPEVQASCEVMDGDSDEHDVWGWFHSTE
ncbi:MAG: hypothetical protein JOZ45_11090 [Acidobacteriaceae bacterium]|nr:hypothetical protein [Acidobacteriaceae bacterium]MBV9938070.1 hypothetical protein [Acidobacteriaceae bacterium]